MKLSRAGGYVATVVGLTYGIPTVVDVFTPQFSEPAAPISDSYPTVDQSPAAPISDSYPTVDRSPVLRQAELPEVVEVDVRPKAEAKAPRGNSCDPNYAGACVPLYPPDVNCGDLSDRRFSSIGSDPHGLDRDQDGTACES